MQIQEASDEWHSDLFVLVTHISVSEYCYWEWKELHVIAVGWVKCSHTSPAQIEFGYILNY